MSAPTEEHVVLVDDAGNATGTAAKAIVHHRSTPLHLAFSVYVFDHDGRLLLTRRALTKRTWPGVWTNTACGHPSLGEDVFEAARRRAGQELGIVVDTLRLVLPTFRYHAVMANGVVENEICPVLVGTTSDAVAPDVEEVDQVQWVDWEAFAADVLHGRRSVSPWCVEQVRALVALGPEPDDWPTSPSSLLPAAARAADG